LKFSLKKQISKENVLSRRREKSFWIFRNIHFLDMESSKLINYLTDMCWGSPCGLGVLFNYLHVTWWCGWSHLICHGLIRALHWITLCVFPLIEECVEPATKGDVSLLKQSSAHLFSMPAAWSPPTPPIGYILFYLLYSRILEFILISCGGHPKFNYASFVMGIFD